MRRTVLLTLALALTASTAIAQQNMGDMDMGKMGDMKGMDMSGQKDMPDTTHKAVGVVKKIDAETRMVTFAHGPVKSLNWPAMTMGFAVKDKALLGKLAVGKKVEFEFIKEGEGYTVTSVK